MKLKTKASWVMALTVTMTLLVIGGVFHVFLEKSLRTSINAGLEVVVNTAADSINHFLSSNLRDVRAVAASLPLDVIVRQDSREAEAQLAKMLEVFPQFGNGLFILDASGELWADYPRTTAVRGKSFAFREYFQQTMKSRHGVVGQPYRSARSGEPVCTFTAPLFDPEGKLLGMVGCSIKLLSKEAFGILHSQTIGDTGYLHLIDQTRLMIMHPQKSRILRRDAPPGANLLFDKALKGFEGVGDTVNSRGVPMLVAFKRVPLTNWILAAQQPKAEALAPLKSMQIRLAVGVLLGSLLAVLVGLWVIRSISKPISNLSQAAADLGRKPLPNDNPALTRGDEIGDLARSFREISQGLHRTFSELREAERRLKTAQSVAHVGSWELDLADGKYWGSDEAGRIYGIPQGSAGRLPMEQIRQICLEKDRPSLDKALNDLLAGRGANELNYRIRRLSDGEVRDICSNAALIPSDDGGPGKVVGTVRDVTESRRVEADIRIQAEELTALNALGRDLNSDLSLQHTVQVALRGLSETMRSDMVFLFLLDGEQLVLQGALPDDVAQNLTAVGDHRLGQCVCGLAVQKRQALFSQDISNDQRFTCEECRAAGVKSIAAIPLIGSAEVIGVIGIASYERHDFQSRTDFLETLASQVSVAITNAQLFEKAQEELGQHQKTLKALVESQDRYRALSDKSPLAISLITKGGRYEYINSAFIDMFGYTLEDIPTREEWFRLAYPDEGYRRETFEKWSQDAAGLQPGQVTNRTLKITSKDGALKSILLRVVALPSGSHFIIYEDITERLRYEESLRESEERFRLFIERSPVAIAITDSEQFFEYVNPKFSQTFGYELADLPDLDTWWVKAYPDPKYRQEVMADWYDRERKAHLIGSEVAQVERMVRCKDGTDKVVVFHGAPVGDKTMVVLLDATAERKAVSALMESEARLRRFMDATPVGIHMYRHQAEGQLELTGYNEAADRILGLDHSTLLGKSILDAFPALAGTDIPEHYMRAADQGVTWRDEKITYKHGRISGAYEVTAFQTSPGNIAAMFNDISQRLRDQEELRILEKQLVRSQKLEALGTLASGIAHDFNNILQALRGRVELLVSDTGLSESTRHHIENMQRSITRAAQLVARMLSFSRGVEYKLTALDLNREVLSAVEMLKHVLPRMVEIQTELSQEACLIMGDSNRLEQVILNFATNARDAMPDGGTLLFRTLVRDVPQSGMPGPGLEPGEYVVLEVSDNGLGMRNKTLDRIFEPFFSTKEPGKGTGLGLYSAFGIIREHGGTITCQSRHGHGTTFTVLLPRAKAAPEADRALKRIAPSIHGEGEAILVVDDDAEVSEPLIEALAAQGYRVYGAASGEEALTALEEPDLGIDIVLLDLNMPGMGGEKTLSAIKSSHPKVRVIIASGYQDRALVKRLFKEGADHFVGKPFDFKKLHSSLRAVLEKVPGSTTGKS
jgi:two-component system cell cycle sensor histidine kinase/response regulator CckA